MKKKYPFIQQHGEEDCGAACLASVAKHYGLRMSLRHIRDLVGTGQNGTNLWGLQQGATKLGFNTRAVKAAPELLERISEAPLPCIIHWNGNHWIVLYGKQGRKFVVVDPGIGVIYLSAQELTAGWKDWVMLLLEPDPHRFNQSSERQSASGIQQIVAKTWSYRGILGQAIALNTVVGILALASPVLLQILTDDVLTQGDFQFLNTLAIAVMVLILISNILELVQSHLITHFAQRLELSLVLDFCQHILRLPLSYYETHRSGEIVSRVQDIQQINYLISQVIVNLPSQFFIALVSLGLMLFYSWKLSVIAVGVAIAMTFSVVILQPMLKRKTQRALVTDSENQGVLVETFKGALTLKTTTAMPQFWNEFQGRFSRLATLNLQTNQIAIINSNFSNLVGQLGGISLLWVGGLLVMNPTEQFTIGQLLAFKALSDRLVHFITTVINFIDELTRVQAATQRLAEVTATTPEGEDNTHKAVAKIAKNAAIVCSNISFDYPGRANLIADLSIQIPGGQVTAMIGQSGCGKSTLAKLLAGLHSPHSGNIRIGSYNQQDLALDSLRQQVMLVPQEPHFWNRSILENFRLGVPDASFEQVVAACQIAGADEFISKLPDKYQTILGEFATNLSGGQRQRLAIARALVRNPAVLILDESTSGLDPTGEMELLDRLLEHRCGQTTIVISHRPSVIQRATWFVVLENGCLKSQGTRSEVFTQGDRHLEALYSTDANLSNGSLARAVY
ncbi:peptidase domain-containing ABC transporter [Gloeocapsa sp. BRSZ]